MRSAVRPFLALTLAALLLVAALATLRGLGAADPRGRASWAGTSPTLDATPRDVRLFLPACDVRAIVLHPVEPSSGVVDAAFFVAMPDGSSRRGPSVEADATPGAPIVLPLGETRPPWRAPLVVRLRHHGGLLTLDARRPITLDVQPSTAAGYLPCAFDGGSRAKTALLLGAILAVMAFAAVVGAAWLARAWGLPRGHAAVKGATALAVVSAGATVVTYVLVVPPFEPPDELAHLQYARYVATTGSLPRAVPPPDSEWRASSYEFVQQPLYYLGAAAILAATGLDAPGPALTVNPRSRMRPAGTEPTIFLHDGPRTSATGDRAVSLLRIVALLMALTTTWLVARLTAVVSRDPLVIVTVAGGLGLIPQWCAVMGAVSTDPPATLLAAASTLAIVGIAQGRLEGRGHVVTGALIGAAYAVKATSVFLVPMAALACLLDAANREHLGQAPRLADGVSRAVKASMRPLLLVCAGVVLTAAWIHVRAWLVFGDPQAFAFKKAILEAGGFVPLPGPMPWTAEFWHQMRVMVFEPFWARFGSLGAGPFPGSRVWVIYGLASMLIAVLATAGCLGAVRAGVCEIRAGRGANAACRLLAVAVCALGVGVGLAAWAAVNLVPRADMVVHWTPRHILPLTAPAALLVAAGLDRIRDLPSMTRRALAAVTGLSVVGLALAWLGVLRATMLMLHFGY